MFGNALAEAPQLATLQDTDAPRQRGHFTRLVLALPASAMHGAGVAWASVAGKDSAESTFCPFKPLVQSTTGKNELVYCFFTITMIKTLLT